MEEQKKSTQVELGETGEIDLPTIDVTQYIGKKTKIESVSEHQGNWGYYIKVESEVLETITGGKDDVVIKASRIFGLQEDNAGKIGWGEGTNLGLFLKKMGVKHYNDLAGKEVIVQTVTNKNDGKDYLSF